MVKVSIRDYMPPCTTWMQVELEEELCGSADIKNPTGEYGEIEHHDIGTLGKDEGITSNYEINQTTWGN